MFTPTDYDAALGDAIDELPRVDARGARRRRHPRRAGARAPAVSRPFPGLRLVVYREPSLSQARDPDDLGRLARADLVRAIVWQLDLDDEHAHELSREPVAF